VKAVALLILTAGLVGAQTNELHFDVLHTLDGHSYVNATITRRNATYATVIFDGGGARVAFTNLSTNIQQAFGFDPVRAQAETELENRTKQQSQQLQAAAVSAQLKARIAREKALRAADWPEWRGPNRNGSGTSAEVLASSWPPEGPRKIWVTHELPSGGNSSPVVANGRVYVYIHQRDAKLDTVVCLDEKTGEKKWQRNFPVAMVTLHDASGTPCISGGRCLVMGARFCYCLDAASGVLIWENDTRLPSKDPALTGPRQEVCSSFAIVAGVAVVLCGPPLGYDLQTGKLLWQAQEGGGWSGANSSVSVCPADRIVYAGQHRLSCLDAKTGRIIWELPGGGKHLVTYGVTPVLSGNILLATSQEALRGFDLSSETPRELWHVPYGEEFSTPAADADHFFMLDPGFTYKAGTDRSTLRGAYHIVCRNLNTGDILWHTPIPESQYSSPITVGGKVFILTGNSVDLQMLDALDGRLLGSTAVGAVRWSTPAIAHGKMFLRISHGVACYDLTASGQDTARSTTPP
jgi:outer membrane protein assembly factor BamB